MTKNEAPQGDLEKTKILKELFDVDIKLRDDAWKSHFLENVADAALACSNPQVINGPDGFPYFVLNIPEPNKPFQSFVLRDMIPGFLLGHGLGVVFSPQKENPDWVFSYGDIVNFDLKNEFYTQSDNWGVPQTNEVTDTEEQVLVSQPSEYILPNETREVLRQFFKFQQIEDAKIALLNRPKGEEFSQQLVFNLTPDKFRDHQHFNQVMANILWFLPKHYSYNCLEESVLGDNFLEI